MYGRSTICLLVICTPLYGLEASLISSSQNLATVAQSFSPYMSFINWLKHNNYIIQEQTEFAQPVYQIRVQNQLGLTCAGYSLRNSLYLMVMLNFPAYVRYNFFQKANTFINKINQNSVLSVIFSINHKNIPQKLLEDTSTDNKKKELIKQA